MCLLIVSQCARARDTQPAAAAAAAADTAAGFAMEDIVDYSWQMAESVAG